MARVNYLNNRDLLEEIHKSKTSFSSFTNPSYNQYDIIVHDLSEINNEIIEQGKANKAKKLTIAEYESRKERGEKVKQADCEVLPDSITTEELVFRLMTGEHIPFNLLRKKNPKTDADRREKVNFPPFQHWKYENGELVCVGKSHWKGNINTGTFSKSHGKITDKLARMFIKLCERYATRGNVRGYCVDQRTEALTKRGWVGIDEIDGNDVILSYTDNKLTWSNIKSIYRGEFHGYMHSVTSQNIDFLITPEHKLVTERGLVKIESVKQSDQIVVMGDAVDSSTDKIYSDAAVELVGKIVCFANNESQSTQFATSLLGNTLDMDFILNLTYDQQVLLINTISDNIKNINYLDLNCISIIQALVALTGKSSTYQYNINTNKHCINILSTQNNRTTASCLDFNGGVKESQNVPTVAYKGRVWCPETEYGCFVARRNGKVHLTGNTYNDEMRGQAILQLAQIGLQFDESKSNNPFAYFTAVVTNSFVRVINIEKKNQNIRDDLLEINGMSPSYTRTNNHEYESELRREEYDNGSRKEESKGDEE